MFIRSSLLTLTFILTSIHGWTNSVNLLNDSPYSLQAQIIDANENMLSEATLNPGDFIQWSDDEENLGTGYNPPSSQTPFTVNWFCMQGSPYGSCENIASGGQVNAQDCTGAQECESQPSSQ